MNKVFYSNASLVAYSNKSKYKSFSKENNKNLNNNEDQNNQNNNASDNNSCQINIDFEMPDIKSKENNISLVKL